MAFQLSCRFGEWFISTVKLEKNSIGYEYYKYKTFYACSVFFLSDPKSNFGDDAVHS